MTRIYYFKCACGKTFLDYNCKDTSAYCPFCDTVFYAPEWSSRNGRVAVLTRIYDTMKMKDEAIT